MRMISCYYREKEKAMETIQSLLIQTRQAALHVRRLTDVQRKTLLIRIGALLKEHTPAILAANRNDRDRMADTDPKKDRLVLNEERIAGLIASLNEVTNLPDPTNRVIASARMENGLLIEKHSVPMGVVGVIYESRPNVTVDVAALCLRSGNAVVLRGGTDAAETNMALVQVIQTALSEAGVPEAAVTLLPADRKFVQELLEAVQYVDIIIPRGSQELIDFVRAHSRVPTIETGAGVCHTYVSSAADLEKAVRIVVNAKVSRPSVCNALDTIVVDRQVAPAFLPLITEELLRYNVEVFADEAAHAILEHAAYPLLKKATQDDFGREFLDFKCSVKTVDTIDEALEHIRNYSSKHSEAIVSENPLEQERFLEEVDAAAVYVNASTRFTDGGCFGLGAEIGISTQKLHARGPFALEKLVTEKWFIRGDGQVR